VSAYITTTTTATVEARLGTSSQTSETPVLNIAERIEPTAANKEVPRIVEAILSLLPPPKGDPQSHKPEAQRSERYRHSHP
jgi:hypothetical protein